MTKIPNDRHIEYDGYRATMGELRDLIKEIGIKPGELFGKPKDASNAHDFSAIKWTKIKTFKELREIVEEIKVAASEFYTDAELQADPETAKEDPDDTSHIPGEPDPEPLTEEEKKEAEHIPGDEPEGSSSDEGEADHIPD